jgi:Fe-Mn family superoxide dismutase
MPFKLPDLPFAPDALAPVMSRETIELHYGKHHKGYVDKLNKLVRDTDLETKSLEELIVNIQAGDIFNNAAQTWNHTFFWRSLTPSGAGLPEGKLKETLERQYGAVDTFKDQFSEAAATLFGSGWVWLVRLANGALSIEKTHNAENPLAYGHTALLTLDVWEHAYYVDYRNDRAAFVKAFWDIVDWAQVDARFEKADSRAHAATKSQMKTFDRPRPAQARSGNVLHAP